MDADWGSPWAETDDADAPPLTLPWASEFTDASAWADADVELSKPVAASPPTLDPVPQKSTPGIAAWTPGPVWGTGEAWDEVEAKKDWEPEGLQEVEEQKRTVLEVRTLEEPTLEGEKDEAQSDTPSSSEIPEISAKGIGIEVPPEVTEEKEVEHTTALSPEEEDDDFGDFADEEFESTVPENPPPLTDAELPSSSPDSPTSSILHPALNFPPLNIDLELISKIHPIPISYPTPPPVESETISTTGARKAWYRLTKAGSLRRSRIGDDEDYVHVTWIHSTIRKEVNTIVSKWATEDNTKIIGPGGFRNSTGPGSMFGWGNSATAEPKRHSLVTQKAQKSVQEHSRHVSDAAAIRSGLGLLNTTVKKPLEKGIVATPLAASLGWGSLDNASPTRSPPAKRNSLVTMRMNPDVLPSPPSKFDAPAIPMGNKAQPKSLASPKFLNLPVIENKPAIPASLDNPAENPRKETSTNSDFDEWAAFERIATPTPQAPPPPDSVDNWGIFETPPSTATASSGGGSRKPSLAPSSAKVSFDIAQRASGDMSRKPSLVSTSVKKTSLDIGASRKSSVVPGSTKSSLNLATRKVITPPPMPHAMSNDAWGDLNFLDKRGGPETAPSRSDSQWGDLDMLARPLAKTNPTTSSPQRKLSVAESLGDEWGTLESLEPIPATNGTVSPFPPKPKILTPSSWNTFETPPMPTIPPSIPLTMKSQAPPIVNDWDASESRTTTPIPATRPPVPQIGPKVDEWSPFEARTITPMPAPPTKPIVNDWSAFESLGTNESSRHPPKPLSRFPTSSPQNRLSQPPLRPPPTPPKPYSHSRQSSVQFLSRSPPPPPKPSARSPRLPTEDDDDWGELVESSPSTRPTSSHALTNRVDAFELSNGLTGSGSNSQKQAGVIGQGAFESLDVLAGRNSFSQATTSVGNGVVDLGRNSFSRTTAAVAGGNEWDLSFFDQKLAPSAAAAKSGDLWDTPPTAAKQPPSAEDKKVRSIIDGFPDLGYMLY